MATYTASEKMVTRRRCLLSVAAVALILLAFTQETRADLLTQSYIKGDEVPVYVNTVAPFKNPTETYSYFDKLPICHPDKIEHRRETLGEILEGNRLVDVGYDVHFQENMERTAICTMTLTNDIATKFKEAIDNLYYFQLFVDDLPVGGFVGTVEAPEDKSAPKAYFLYNFFEFAMQHNKDRIVRANLTNTDIRDAYFNIDEYIGREVKFYYAVSWSENTEIDFYHRMEQFAEHPFFNRELEIHWLSILNSVILVVLLTSFLFVILMRVLRNDYMRYAAVEVDPEEDTEDYGWKLIHGDVFRFPGHRMMLSSMLGTGTQLLVLMVCLLFLGGMGLYYPYSRGAMKTSIVIIHAITNLIAGWTSASFYKQIGGENWVWNIILTSVLMPGPLAIVWSFLNTVAWSYQSTQALPFGTIIALMVIWSFVGFPLTVVGGIIGKNRAGTFDAPCRTRNIPREIPVATWYHHPAMHLMMAGFLPFSAISIELYYIFATVWGHKLYTLYGILIIVFCILLIVTSFITIALTYFQLSIEDYRWWWRSFINGGSSALFVYAYATFYYINRSSMSGFMQGTFFFGYVAICCYFFFLMMGAVGFLSALFFVRQIYKNFKAD